jgi:hypothetical protein
MTSQSTDQLDITKALGRIGISQPITELLSAAQIRDLLPKWYRILAFMLHPDQQVGASPEDQARAKERFKLLEDAYSAVSSSANNPNAWATLMGALGASETRDSVGQGTSEALDSERAIKENLSKQVASLTSANSALTRTLNAILGDILHREAVSTDKTGHVSALNILSPGSCIFRVSEGTDGDDMDLALEAKPKTSTLVTLTTDERKNVVNLRVNKGKKADYAHLIGATIIGAIDNTTYANLGRGPYGKSASRDALKLTSSTPSRVDTKEPWAITREQFSGVVLPHIRLTASEGMALVFVKNDSTGPSRYYVSFAVGTDSPTQKKLSAIEHNPLP